MVSVWIDFSGKPPRGETLAAAGVQGVLGYIGLGREDKQIHRPVHDDYISNGLRVGLVAELGISDAWASADDYTTGIFRAQISLDDATRDAPEAEFICCAADAHASSQGQITDAVAYAEGFSSVLGFDFSGFYGFSETSRAVHNSGCCRVHWRAGSEPTGADRDWVNFWQRNINNPGRPATGVFNGTLVDFNEVIKELNHMSGEADKLISDMNIQLARIKKDTDAGKLDPRITGPVINKANYDVLIDGLGAAQRTETKIDDLSKNVGRAISDFLAANPPTIDIDYAKLAKAVNDDADARSRDNDPSTGPRT